VIRLLGEATLAFLVVVGMSGAGAGKGDPVRGERAFQYCYSCHSVQPGETNLEGPNLRGIVGRKIATQDGFPYSPAMRAFAQREDRWSEALLQRYLAFPYRVVPKTSMAFPGMTEESERTDLIAFLRTTGRQP
jgi:cytochrome c